MIYLKLLLTAIFWGGTFIAGKMIAGSVHPVCAAFLRFVIASLFLTAITIHREGRLPALHRGQILPVLLLGGTGVFAYNILFFTGLKHIDAGRASLIIATNPILISLVSAICLKEEINCIKSAGIGLSVAGAMLVISNGHLVDMASYVIGPGELLIFGCVISWVAYSLAGKVIMGRLTPLTAVTYASIAGTVLLAIPAWHAGVSRDMGGYGAIEWMSLFYLGFFGTVLGFFWYYQGIQRIGAMKASVFINFVPISAVGLSILLLDEPITISLLFGGTLVLLGVYTTNASDRLKRYGLNIIGTLRSVKG